MAVRSSLQLKLLLVLFFYLPINNCYHIIHALITSRVDYCNSLLYRLPATQLNKIQHVLDAAARLLCRSPRYWHTIPFMYNLHWLPVNLRIRFKVLLFAFKAIHGVAPSYISDLILVKPNIYSSYNLRSWSASILLGSNNLRSSSASILLGSNNLRSSSASILLAFASQKTMRTLGDRWFSVAASTLWNKLPRDLRDLEDFTSFKQKLKIHLFMEAYSQDLHCVYHYFYFVSYMCIYRYFGFYNPSNIFARARLV